MLGDVEDSGEVAVPDISDATDSGEGSDVPDVPDSGFDTGPPLDTAGDTGRDTGPRDTGDSDVTTTVTPGSGEIVINEFMADPVELQDENGEWIELYNPSTSRNYDLDGCILRDKDINSHTIQAPNLVVGADSYVTLVSDTSSGPGFNSPDYEYVRMDFQLGNSGDEVVLECNGTVVDEVDYDMGPNWDADIPEGKSLGLDPGERSASSNDDSSNWCPQTSRQSNFNNDRGTPGERNDDC